MNTLGITNVRPLPPPPPRHWNERASSPKSLWLGGYSWHSHREDGAFPMEVIGVRGQSMSRECTAHEIDKLTTTTDLISSI